MPRSISTRVVFAALATLVGCGPSPDAGASFREEIGTAEEPGPDARTDVIIHEPPELHSIATGAVDAEGRPLRAACVSCHGIEGLAGEFRERVEDLLPPHTGIVFEHGTNRCDSCHERSDRLSLHTADGRRVPMTRAIELCRQCHGPQSRDYDHGSHGGMHGAWDLSRGERVRAHCLDCHDAHSPAWTPLAPMSAPVDRYPPASPHGAE